MTLVNFSMLCAVQFTSTGYRGGSQNAHLVYVVNAKSCDAPSMETTVLLSWHSRICWPRRDGMLRWLGRNRTKNLDSRYTPAPSYIATPFMPLKTWQPPPCLFRASSTSTDNEFDFRCIPCPPTTVPLYLNSTAVEHCFGESDEVGVDDDILSSRSFREMLRRLAALYGRKQMRAVSDRLLQVQRRCGLYAVPDRNDDSQQRSEAPRRLSNKYVFRGHFFRRIEKKDLNHRICFHDLDFFSKCSANIGV